MKVTKREWTIEGTSDEIAAILPQLEAQQNGNSSVLPVTVKPTEPTATDETGAVDRSLVDFIKRVLTRRATPWGQEDLFTRLYANPKGLCRNELAPAMNRTYRQFAGMMGALGHRTAATSGHAEQKAATGREGVLLLLDIRQEGDDVRYSLRPETRIALGELRPV